MLLGDGKKRFYAIYHLGFQNGSYHFYSFSFFAEPGVKEWIQIDLHRPYRITRTATQGRYGGGNGKEDAEEFLTFLLNELNDEMLALLKLLIIDDQDEEQDDKNEADEAEEDDNDEWHEVGAKNKSLLTRRVGGSNVSLKTPLGSIFQGQLQSCVNLSNGEPKATLQPFFTLPLDIQSKNIKNVSDALIQNFTSEALHG